MIGSVPLKLLAALVVALLLNRKRGQHNSGVQPGGSSRSSYIYFVHDCLTFLVSMINNSPTIGYLRLDTLFSVVHMLTLQTNKHLPKAASLPKGNLVGRIMLIQMP